MTLEALERHWLQGVPPQAGDQASVLTIGNFDGVHLGHQALIHCVQERARAQNVLSALLTFRPHPLEVLRGKAPPLLTSEVHKLALFAAQGLHQAAFFHFTAQAALVNPQTFLKTYIIPAFRPRQIIVGHDFRFGHRREGAVQAVEEVGRENGFSVEVVEAVRVGETIVGSSAIRHAVAQDDFAAASRLLGRDYSVLLAVQSGAGRGEQIGFPTLNLHPERPLALGRGVYAAHIVPPRQPGKLGAFVPGGATGRLQAEHGRVENRNEVEDNGVENMALLPAVINHGVRPSFGGGETLLEVHLLGAGAAFPQALAAAAGVEVIPRQRLREERRFSSLEALRTQIAHDCAAARNALEHFPASASDRR